MSDDKLSSDEVPGKFTEWLLAMGCPANKVPSQDKITEMCRGQYHMVWRSLMEQVDARDVVREKRMQVFCDDVRCRKKNVFSQHDTSTIGPEQLSLWKQQNELRKAVEDAKARVVLARRDLDQLVDKISTKFSQRAMSRVRVDDQSRRGWLLRQMAAELADKKTNLQETRAIADSLCSYSDDDDAESQEHLDKCLAAYHRQVSTLPSAPHPDGSQLWQLVRRRGAALCARLLERRAALPHELAGQGAESPRQLTKKESPQSVLARSAALHCALVLEATKNKLHLKQTRKKLLATITDLNNCLSGESCELLVVRCENTHAQARAAALRALLDDAAGGSGAFHAAGAAPAAHAAPAAPAARDKPTHAIDKTIESKREELQRVMAALSAVERKTFCARDCLQLLLAAFRRDAAHAQPTHYRGVQLDMPQGAPALRSWYEAGAGRRRARLSMQLDQSDGSLQDADLNNPTFVDELRIYLKKFNLENNRQLVLESGEKIWIFESIQSSTHRLLAACASSGAASGALCSGGPARAAQARARLGSSLRGLRTHTEIPTIDITAQKEEERQITDRTKKRLRENLSELQKTTKIFLLAEQNLKLWSDNNIRKYISPSRKHDGMTYRDYEVYYIENCLNACLRDVQ